MVQECRKFGVTLAFAGQFIDATGPAEAIDSLSPLIVAHKPLLLALLSPVLADRFDIAEFESLPPPVPTDPDEAEVAYEILEQEAIAEFGGG